MPKARSRSRPPKGCYWRGETLWFRAEVKGVERRFSLRTSDVEVARREAERLLARLKAEAYGGEVRHSYMDAVVAWATHIADQVSPNTAARYATSLRVMEPILKPLDVAEIDKKTVARIVAYRRGEKASPATIRRDLTALSSVLTYAEDEGWREGNPALDAMRRLREKRQQFDLPHDADIARVVARAPGLFAEMIRFAAATGLRQEEIASLEWRSISGTVLTVVGKGSKRRTITLSPEARAILGRIPRNIRAPWVFWHSGGDRFSGVATRFVTIMKSAQESAQKSGTEFRRFRFHDLRHLFAVRALQSGWSLYDVQRHLGHGSVKVTEIYLAHLTPEQEATARGSAQNPAHDEVVSRVPAV